MSAAAAAWSSVATASMATFPYCATTVAPSSASTREPRGEPQLSASAIRRGNWNAKGHSSSTPRLGPSRTSEVERSALTSVRSWAAHGDRGKGPVSHGRLLTVPCQDQIEFVPKVKVEVLVSPAVGTYIAPVEEAQETRYVAVGDADVAYQVLGDGPVDLLYFAGLGSHVDVLWEYGPSAAFLRRLASFSRLILFDRRGAGASDAVPNASISTWEAWADDAGAVLDAAGSERAWVFAEVDAGPTAILLAAMHPERVEKLVLANTSARYLVADDYPIGLHPELVDSIVAGIQQTWGTADAVRVVHPDADPELLNWMVKLLRASATPRSAAAQYRYILTSMDVREVLPLIQIPTLVLHTEAHALVPIEQGRYLAANIDGANLVELAPGETYFSPHGYTRCAGRDRRVPDRSAARGRDRPHPHDGALHRHRRVHGPHHVAR